MSDVRDKVNGFITQEILHRGSTKALDPELNLLAEGILDSLGLQMLVGFLEQEFSITIGDDDLLPENFQTIESISQLVSGLQ